MSSVLERSGRVRPEYAHDSKLVRPGSLVLLEDPGHKW
jgi:hypothetical protein